MAREIELWDFKAPDELYVVEGGRVETVRVAGGVLRRFVLEPGWVALGDETGGHVPGWTREPHLLYHAAGSVQLQGPNGHTRECRPGQVTRPPAGSGARVLGEDPVILVDFFDLLAPMLRFPPGAGSTRPVRQ